MDVVPDRIRAGDVALLLLPPALLLLAAALPAPIRESLVLDRADPEPLALLTSHYVHADLRHLLGNVGMYLPTAAAVYLLMLLGGARRRFRLYLAASLLLLPVAISAADLLVFRAAGVTTGHSRGFSGVNAALLGLVPLALVRFLRENLDRGLDRRDSVPLYLLSLSGIPLIYWQGPLTAAALLGLLAVSAHYLRHTLRALNHFTLPELSTEFERKPHLALALAGLWLLLSATVVLFPGDITRDGRIVNVIVHYAGYSLGYLLPYLTWNIAAPAPDGAATLKTRNPE